MKKNIILSVSITSAILLIFLGLNLFMALSSPLIWLRYTNNNEYLSFHNNGTVTAFMNNEKSELSYTVLDNADLIISDPDENTAENELTYKRGVYFYSVNNDGEVVKYVCYPAWTFQILLIIGYTVCVISYAVTVLYVIANKKDSK